MVHNTSMVPSIYHSISIVYYSPHVHKQKVWQNIFFIRALSNCDYCTANAQSWQNQLWVNTKPIFQCNLYSIIHLRIYNQLWKPKIQVQATTVNSHGQSCWAKIIVINSSRKCSASEQYSFSASRCRLYCLF